MALGYRAKLAPTAFNGDLPAKKAVYKSTANRVVDVYGRITECYRESGESKRSV